jgi:hypothetical protein
MHGTVSTLPPLDSHTTHDLTCRTVYTVSAWVCSSRDSTKSPASDIATVRESAHVTRGGSERSRVRVDQCVCAIGAVEVPVCLRTFRGR